MKIVKLKTTSIQLNSEGIIKNYYPVKDNHTLTIDEDDVTSVSTLLVFNQNNAFDFGVFRDSLQNNVIPQWANILWEDRKKCVQYYKYPANLTPGEFESYFTPDEHQNNWNILTANVRETRRQRLFAAFNKISYEISMNNVAIIYMTTKTMLMDYYYANLPHIIFWVQNGAYPPLGIDYTNNGFAQMPGYSVMLKNSILDIINNGNYENAEKQLIV